MSLMKWMRKNNKKLMAVVVIGLMIAFIGGPAFKFLFRGGSGAKEAIAYYGHKQKITAYDRWVADQELKLLEDLGAAAVVQRQGMAGLFLGELLFPQGRDSANVLEAARQGIQQNQLRVSDKQLHDMYKTRAASSDFYWILLCEEAQSAGTFVSNEEVRQTLGRIVPRLFGDVTYGDMMKVWMAKNKMSEASILSTYGKLLAVLQYAQVVSSMEDITLSQMRHVASDEVQSLDAQYVQFQASAFEDKQQTLSDDAMRQHFDRYKAYHAGDVNDANPFGFGYRLPNRVQLDYIAVKLSDVTSLIKTPTVEDAELYYQQNRERRFTEKVPSDPNDPNSQEVDQVRGYAEVFDDIMVELKRQRITTKAEQILQDARNVADAEINAAGPDGNEPTTEERRIRVAKPEHDYGTIAQNLSVKYNVPLYSGRTGLLSAADMRADSHLRRMSLISYGRNPLPLVQAVFSVEEFGDNATILFSAPQAKMYLTIGPAKDPLSESAKDVSNQIMVIVRVVAAEPDAAPASLDATYSIETLNLSKTPEETAKVFTVKEQVAKDVRALAAWDTTKTRAGEFIALATKDGWEKALSQFNKLYGEQAKADPNDPNVFQLDRRMSMRRISRARQEMLATQMSNIPAADSYLRQGHLEGLFVDKLLSLIPESGDVASKLPEVVEFQPDLSCYAIKTLSVRPLYQEQFQKIRGMVVSREESGEIQSLVVVHLNPENIIKRMNFKFVEQSNGKQAKKESKGTS